jgi:hypothetical protein
MFERLRNRIADMEDAGQGWIVKGVAGVAILACGVFVAMQLFSGVSAAPGDFKPLPPIDEMGLRFYDPVAKEVFIIPFDQDIAPVYAMACNNPRKNRVPSPLSNKRRVGISMERCMECGEFFVPKFYTNSKLAPDAPGAFVCSSCGKDNESDYAPRGR